MIFRDRISMVELTSDIVKYLTDSEYLDIFAVDEYPTDFYSPGARSYGVKWIAGPVNWRMVFRCELTTLDIIAGTEFNINDNTETAVELGTGENEIPLKYVGQMGDTDKPFFYKEEDGESVQTVGNSNSDDADQEVTETSDFLYSGFVGISDHGITISVWISQLSNYAGYGFSWCGIQSLREPTSKSPIVAVHGKGFSSEEYVKYCILRETDVNIPTVWVDATRHQDQVFALFNTNTMVAVDQDNSYCVFFPMGFNTQRYFYPNELDMIGYTSADILSAESQFTDDRFGVETHYRALHANGKFNTGMRPVLFEEYV